MDVNLSALTEQAWSRVEANQLDEARLLFKKICEADEGDSEAWMMLGSLHAEFTEDGEAVLCLEKALQLDPTYPDAHYNLAKIRVKQGRVDEAQKHCGMAVKADPGYAAAWQLFGAIYEILGNFLDSEMCSRKAIALFPANPVSHTNLALALWKQGKLQESIQGYRKSLELEPRQIDVWLQLAAVLTHQNLLLEAEQCYRKAISLDPSKFDAYERLSGIFARLGRVDDEIEVLLEALRLKPNNGSIHLQLGKAYHAQRQWDAAENSFREAIRLMPGNAEGYFGLGAIFGVAGLKNEELEHFRQPCN